MSASPLRPPSKASPSSSRRSSSQGTVNDRSGHASAKRPDLLGRLGQWFSGRKDREGASASADSVVDSTVDSTLRPAPALPATPHADAIVAQSGLTPAAELSAAQDGLRELLARHPQARTVVPHLAYVLHALREDGFTALKAAPKYVTKQALKQLDLLTGKNLSPSLNILRTRLISVAFSDEIEGSEGALSSLITATDHSVASVSLSEASLDEFLAETEHWEATQRDPGPSTTAANLRP